MDGRHDEMDQSEALTVRREDRRWKKGMLRKGKHIADENKEDASTELICTNLD